jgi:hypothetical protein
MPRSNAARRFQESESRYYPVLLLDDAQQALSALADIDFRYEALVEKLDGRRHNSARNMSSLRDRLLERQTRERRRCVEKLDDVQARLWAAIGIDPRE